MVPLFEPGRHEPLNAAPWNPLQARQALRDILADLAQHRQPGPRWPLHPQDDEGDTPATGFKGLYLGSAGVLWALWWLKRQGCAEAAAAGGLFNDLQADIRAVHAAYLADPDSGAVVPSYFLGESGIALVRWLITGEETAAQALAKAVADNIANPTNEALWAAPGSVVAAWHAWQASGDTRWRRLCEDNYRHIRHLWQADEALGCHLWTQDLYGRVRSLLGAGHGFAGNAFALLQGAALLPEAQRIELARRCMRTLQATVRRSGEAANWPATATPPGTDPPYLLMQWCHGAPGMVTGLAGLPAEWAARSADAHEADAFDRLLCASGEAIWQAGPLAKGPGLCHGTAGNGMAFLALHARTANALWLQRARAFAMHAIGQCEAARRQHGHGRHTLWTGDVGVALYLWHCLQAQPGMPTLDYTR